MVMTVNQRQRWETWVDGKITLGLCPRCGKNPIKPGKDSCRACILKARRRRIRLYHKRLQNGSCPHCGGKREDPGIIGCRSCNAKITEQRVRLYDRKKKAIYQKHLYHGRLKQKDICPVCGRAAADPEFTLCSPCRQQGRKYYYLHREQRIAHSRQRYLITHKPKPLCPVCDHHRYSCPSCGKMMKVNHGQESCLYICRCGNIITFTRELELTVT